jgi:hypothetical protein
MADFCPTSEGPPPGSAGGGAEDPSVVAAAEIVSNMVIDAATADATVSGLPAADSSGSIDVPAAFADSGADKENIGSQRGERQLRSVDQQGEFAR